MAVFESARTRWTKVKMFFDYVKLSLLSFSTMKVL